MPVKKAAVTRTGVKATSLIAAPTPADDPNLKPPHGRLPVCHCPDLPVPHQHEPEGPVAVKVPPKP